MMSQECPPCDYDSLTCSTLTSSKLSFDTPLVKVPGLHNKKHSRSLLEKPPAMALSGQRLIQLLQFTWDMSKTSKRSAKYLIV